MHQTLLTGIVHTRRALMAQGWTDGQILRARRAGRLITMLPGTYVTAGDHDPRDAFVACLRAHFGPDVVAVLDSAGTYFGLPRAWPGDSLVHVALPPGREQAQPRGVRIHTWALRNDELTTTHGLTHTTIERTLVDVMCTYDRLSAVSALDAALHLGLMDANQLAGLASTVRHRRGAARSRPWWSLADGLAESPLETRVRLRAIDGGYPPDVLQKEFVVQGRRYRADLAWRQPNGRWLVGEADGRHVHELPEALLHDRHRANDLVGMGDVDMVRFVWADSTNARAVPRVLSRLLGPPRR